jgi:alpha-D-ribose 1-methylphosphonate 5-phosphate C-P lyase
VSLHLFDHGWRIDVREADAAIIAGGRLVATAYAFTAGGWHVLTKPSVLGPVDGLKVADHDAAKAALIRQFPTITEIP